MGQKICSLLFIILCSFVPEFALGSDVSIVSSSLGSSSVPAGSSLSINASVQASQTSDGIVCFTLFNAAGVRVGIQSFGNQHLVVNEVETYSWNYVVPAGTTAGTYTVKLAVYSLDWLTFLAPMTTVGTYIVPSSSTTAPAASFAVTSLVMNPSIAAPGQTVTFTATVLASAAASDVNVEFVTYNSAGGHENSTPNEGQSFNAGQWRNYTWSYIIPTATPAGKNILKVGVANTAWTSWVYPLTQIGTFTTTVVAGTILTDPSVTFDQNVGTLNLTEDWKFGTAAVAASSVGKTIKSATDLAVDFQPLAAWIGATTINSEMERYAKTFTTPNFVFDTDHLSLKAIKGTQSLNAIIGSTKTTGTSIYMDGTANPIAEFGITSTSGLTVGQLVVIAGHLGMARISAIVANTSISLLPVMGASSSIILSNNCWVMFTQSWWAISTSAVASGATTLQFSSVPTPVAAGMTVAVESSAGTSLMASDTMTVVSRTTTTVVLNSPGFKAGYAPPAGKGFIFYPAISSGQIWSKNGYSPFLTTGGIIAMEFTIQLPGGGSPSESAVSSIYTKDKLTSQPATYPWGAWSAAWLYQLYNGDTTKHHDSSEIDFESWWMANRGPSAWTGYNHGSTYNRTYKATTLGTWDISPAGTELLTPNAGQLALNSPLNSTQIKVQLIWMKDKVMKYINGQLVSIDDYVWTSDFPAMFGVNLAIGSLQGYYPGLLLMPWNDAQFDAMELKVYQIRIWSY